MQFNSTFTDPTKKIYYPRTWGGKTAVELFEEMKKQFWYIGLGVILSIAGGILWCFLLYTYIVFLKFLWRISLYNEENSERIRHQEYLEAAYIFRWALLGVILFGTTIFFLIVPVTRQGLIYGLLFWIPVLLFKSRAIWVLQKFKRWIWKKEYQTLHQQ